MPNALIHAQAELKLSATDLVVILNLLSHWWYGKRTPFPSSALIAKRSGLGVRTVQRSLRKLCKKGLIERIPRIEGGRRYKFDGLVAHTEEKAITHEWRKRTREQRLPLPEIVSFGEVDFE